MKPNEKLKYIGKGFLGFNPLNTEMIFLENYSNHDIYVMYENKKMIVRINEIETIK